MSYSKGSLLFTYAVRYQPGRAKTMMRKAHKKADGNVRAASKLLGISPPTWRRAAAELGLGLELAGRAQGRRTDLLGPSEVKSDDSLLQ